MQGAVKVSMQSPGIVYEPYASREPISFWKRLVEFLSKFSTVLTLKRKGKRNSRKIFYLTSINYQITQKGTDTSMAYVLHNCTILCILERLKYCILTIVP